ncbi:hypothetical protein BG653_05637 [Streptomyces platensis]|uniref:Uncharacterized protein n=1 Tax=Streptomyces platensis TaxID=58346 RepID=A0ABX3XRL2_STRPT|nr:hypothetical protein BG653_05637 [Streptomyces platensis]
MSVTAPPTRAAVAGGVASPKSTVTVPVGVPAPGGTGATVAVRVTGCPTTAGSGPALTSMVVAAGYSDWEPVPWQR